MSSSELRWKGTTKGKMVVIPIPQLSDACAYDHMDDGNLPWLLAKDDAGTTSSVRKLLRQVNSTIITSPSRMHDGMQVARLCGSWWLGKLRSPRSPEVEPEPE